MTEVTSARISVAIYTRKSTDDGLEQEFNSLDAQYEAALAYIAHRRHLGWYVVAERYDDGGYTGGTMERPALQRLLRDLERGAIQVVVTYKLDRITRSLIDFANLMALFERYGVHYVSITQEFDSSTPVGRLTLNILSSFAQYEREIICERTRDKMAASRRRGMYTGGIPPFGYALDPITHKLIIDPTEAEVVRLIFTAYVRGHSVTAIMHDLNAQGIPKKRHAAATGRAYPGGRWYKAYLHKILANPLYRGQVRYRGEIYPGQQPPLVDEALWQQVQAVLGTATRTGRAPAQSALLKGRIRCGHCQCAMTPSYARKGARVYRYYLCSRAHRHDLRECPTRSIPAGTVETAVTEHLQQVMHTPDPLLKHLQGDGEVSLAQRQEAYALCATLHQLHGTWSLLQPSVQQQVIRQLIRQVTVYPDRINVAFNPAGALDVVHEEAGRG